MNREILFRGKHTDNGEWVYGFPYAAVGLDSGKWLLTVVARDWLNSHTYQIDPSTIGQYTGLTDKNGKKIFEGDLITTAWWHGHVAKVVFHAGAFRVYGSPLFSWVANETYEVVVVGNVWDNPELLEGD